MLPMTRRRVLLTAGAATAALAAAGCDGGDDSATTEDLSGNRTGAMPDFKAGTQFTATTPLTFSILYSNHADYPLNKDWLFWKELTKRTNVTLTTVAVPRSDYEQKRSLLIGAGDAPTIIPKTYRDQEIPFVSSGAILAVSDYLDLMPNFTTKIAKWNLGADLDTIRRTDGKFYVLPGVHEEVWTDYSVAMRTDVLDKLREPVPRTWDDVHDALAAMKSAYPATIPFSDRFGIPTPGGCLLSVISAAYNTAAGWDYQNAYWRPAQKKFVFTGAMDEYRNMLQFLNTLVRAGLMDREGFTQEDDAAIQKLATEKSFAICANAQSIVNDYRPALAKTHPEAKVAKIPQPAGPAGNVRRGGRLENGVMISSKARQSKDFVAMMQFIDWLWYSDEGEEFARWGVPGVTYTKTPAGEYRYLNGLDGTLPLQQKYGFFNGVFAYGGSTQLLESMFSEEEKEFQKAVNAKTTLPLAPPHPLTDEEQERATLWETPLKDFVAAASLQFILGQRDFAQWDAYLQELETKNMSAYIDLINEAYQRYAKDHG
ncbi:ABC transporter substrate-binding protein [Mangrovihabitans endophyticus]|uniref:Sugar ABC transporter substrate-binding protein n=1 Tax=Mangrovihabitans endophyticus TaxID=1751298 RepID=A0A8J3C339_9ACTN|nr:extracellular solute-binding protein [Mangrovihabitans endophyticus]GGL00339.1 sugar ABC transporter substrate-binding protein [Mangrovihabitans endophyticus]